MYERYVEQFAVAISEKEMSINAVLCGRSFHCCSLQAAVIAKVRDSCIWRESFKRILDYRPDSSPKLD